MGIAGIVMLAMTASGIWAWWPRPGSWWRALRFKRDAAPLRRLYDWHKLIGLGGAILVLVVTATGVMLDLPDQTRFVIARASPLYRTPALAVVARGAPLPVDRLVAIAERVFPGAALAWIETPASPTGAIRINLAQDGEPSRRFPRTNVWLDP